MSLFSDPVLVQAIGSLGNTGFSTTITKDFISGGYKNSRGDFISKDVFGVWKNNTTGETFRKDLGGSRSSKGVTLSRDILGRGYISSRGTSLTPSVLGNGLDSSRGGSLRRGLGSSLISTMGPIL